jgi:hypothetical protein
MQPEPEPLRATGLSSLMAEPHRFDPPLRIASGLEIRTLDEAAGFLRAYGTSRDRARRDRLIQIIDSARTAEQPAVAESVRDFLKSEGLLAGSPTARPRGQR